jgi:hypothetical protein
MKQTVITWRDLSELPDEGEGILSVRKHFDKEEWHLYRCGIHYDRFYGNVWRNNVGDEIKDHDSYFWCYSSELTAGL